MTYRLNTAINQKYSKVDIVSQCIIKGHTLLINQSSIGQVKQIQILTMKIAMKKVNVSSSITNYYFPSLVIEYEIKLKFDEDDILSYQTIVQIFDKRQLIKGIKKMKYDFKVKRRKLLRDNNLAAYKKIVLLYKKAIESKLEDNLRLIANKVHINTHLYLPIL